MEINYESRRSLIRQKKNNKKDTDIVFEQGRGLTYFKKNRSSMLLDDVLGKEYQLEYARFWKRSRKVAAQKQSREDNFVGTSYLEPSPILPKKKIIDPKKKIIDPNISYDFQSQVRTACYEDYHEAKECIAILNECHCCERHMRDRPTTFGPFTCSTKTFRYAHKNCSCCCRHLSRTICNDIYS